MAFYLHQRQIAKQVQVLSQKQIHSLGILSMSTQDLVSEIYRAADDNPLLSVAAVAKRITGDGTRISSSSSKGNLASDVHQAALESHADTRTSLSDHFLRQLNMLNLPPAEFELCEKLIYNLDSRGFHFLAPVSLLDRKNKSHTLGLLEKCMARIQQFDPPGLCVKNMEESLYVQAKQRENVPQLALFILDGKLSLLDPPKTEKIIAKTRKILEEKKKMIGLSEAEKKYSEMEVDEDSVEEALLFIRSLDPFPARDFSTVETHFVAADIIVEKIDTDNDESDSDAITISDSEISLRINLSNENIPQISLNSQGTEILESKNISEDKRKELQKQMKEVKELMEALNYRQNTILRAASEIVRNQIEFFKYGPGHLVPLRLQDIADKLGVHETTISRMSNSKYIQCEWGLYNIKYFFSNSASTKDGSISRDMVLFNLRQILESDTNGKKLSDQKICLALEERGIQISRRTVAKYRNLLNIDSSYKR